MSTKLIARGVKQLDQILHDGGHIVRLRTGGFNQRRGRGNQRHSHRLRPTTTINDGILDLGALTQRLHALGKGGSGQEHIIRALTRLNETIAFVRIKPTNTSARHCHLTFC